MCSKSLIMISMLFAYGVEQADVITDGTVGAATNLSGPNYQIDASLGTQAGGNLFHSFSQFSVAASESATFNGPASVSNIISRVTGGSPSQIDSTLASTIQGADLYLINPQGVLFGKDAQINVPGSLYISTADQIGFADNKVFSANPSGADVLTVAAPASFGFLAPSPANIQINAENLAAATGESLNFVGGDIQIRREGELFQGGIKTDSGEINLVSSAGDNQVGLIDGKPKLSGQVGGAISLGGNAYLQTSTTNNQDAGDIRIQGDTLNVTDQAIIRSVSRPDSTGDTGHLHIQVKQMVLSKDATLATGTQGSGHAGPIEITADQLSLSGDASIASISLSEATGDTGRLQIKAKEIALSENARLYTGTQGSGHARAIEITADQIHLADKALLFSNSFNEATGNGGNIHIQAKETTLSENAALLTNSTGSGDAGSIEIQADQIHLSDQTAILSTVFGGSGNSGRISLHANQLINMAEDARIGTASDGGHAGSIDITADQIHLADNALIESRSYGATGNTGSLYIQARDVALSKNTVLRTTTYSSGHAGMIEVMADQIHLADNAGMLSSSSKEATGNGGNMRIQAKDMTLSGNAVLLTASTGSGHAGSIEIQADQIHLSGQTFIASRISEGSGNSGNITLDASQLIRMTGDARIDATNDSGQAGRIEIKTDQIHLADKAAIASSNSSVVEETTGNGGDIYIQVKEMTLSEGAHLFTGTYGSGHAGRIEITADQIHLAGNLGIASSSTEESTGDTGSMIIKVKDMTLSEGASLNTASLGSGNAGPIEITADQIHLGDKANIGSVITAAGNTGSIFIQVKNITLTDKASLLIGSTDSGNAKRIDIKAEQIHLTDNAFIQSGITSGSGGFGEIHLEASQSIRLTENAAIASNKPSGVGGDSGNIHITTPYLSLIGQGDTDGDGDMVNDSARITVNALSGSVAPPGNIRINSDRIYLANGATISAKSDGLRNAGNIEISGAGSLSLQSAYISTNSASAKGGNIDIGDFKRVDLQNSYIETSASAGEGDGGNVNITTQLVALDNSHIRANSAGASGGRLDIQSTLVRTPDSTTTARGVAQAQDGEVLITDEINPDQALLDSELGFLANEVKVPCSVVVAEEDVVLNVSKTKNCYRVNSHLF